MAIPIATASAASLLVPLPAPTALDESSVHLWAWSVDDDPSLCARAWAVLDNDERVRAARFVAARHRVRFAVMHAVVRHVLAGYLGACAAELRFAREAGGKPLVREAAAAGLHFNLSHSGERAVLAVARSPVGADVEHQRPGRNVRGLAGRYFHRSERAAIEAASDARRAAVFFRYWVAKEAVLKAQGTGLALPLAAFEVVFDADEDRARVVPHDRRLAGDWTVQLGMLGAAWPVAVAAAGRGWSVEGMPG